jgi:large subunit ribosomal protein L18e
VIALSFSKRAEEKIDAAGGKCLGISEILDENPKGNKIRIIE